MLHSVLVVDDDDAFRALVVQVLEHWGHAPVDEAATVAGGLLRAAARRPEVALVDVGLPDGDGFELCRQLCALHPAPRVVVISADADADYPASARQAGATGFVAKTDIAGSALYSLIAGP